MGLKCSAKVGNVSYIIVLQLYRFCFLSVRSYRIGEKIPAAIYSSVKCSGYFAYH